MKTMDRKAKLEYLLNRIYMDELDDRRCWIFTGGIMKNGYGITSWGQTAHSAMWELAKGEMRDGYEIAHIVCGTRSCINPWHLSQLPISEHRRQDGNQYTNATHCVHGHEFTKQNTGYNTYGNRYCKACRYTWRQKWRASKRAAGLKYT
jgi:hypothetical protein